MSDDASRTEPVGPDWEADRPFEPEAAGFSGCGKPAVVGCLVLAGIAVVGLLILFSQSEKLFRWAMEQAHTGMVQALPPDVTEAEAERLERAHSAAVDAVTGGSMDPAGVQKLQQVMAEMPRPGETLSREELERITLLLEEIAGISPPETGSVSPRPPPGESAEQAAPADSQE